MQPSSDDPEVMKHRHSVHGCVSLELACAAVQVRKINEEIEKLNTNIKTLTAEVFFSTF